jgi:uncharacterized protein
MRYWDSSALAPLLVDEPRSAEMSRLFQHDPDVVTWGWSRVELAGTIERLTRTGTLSRSGRRDALDRFAALALSWNEVIDLAAVRSRAVTLLGRHALRAADAGHLGAALLAADDDPSTFEFVCLDRRLAEAAEGEGLRVLS